MRISRVAQSLKDFQIISITNGQKIGKVQDVLVDPARTRLAGIVVSSGSLLSRKSLVIPRDKVVVWGEDVILVENPDVLQPKGKLDGLEDWLSASNNLKGMEVISTDGTKIAEIKDVVINADAQLVGYDLNQVFIEGSINKSKRIAVKATKSLGPDVLIVDPEKMY